MRLVNFEEYMDYLSKNKFVEIEGKKVELTGLKTFTISQITPVDFKEEYGSVWSFKERGNWASHRGNYRGNWPPQIPRNLILKYTNVGDTVLDPMVGSGTTLIEAKILGRKGIGVDINYEAIMLSMDRLNFKIVDINSINSNIQLGEIKLFVGDARKLTAIPDDSIDLIATHPPYWGIIKYSKSKRNENDISHYSFYKYLEATHDIANELFRVLKPGKYCGFLIGDTRRNTFYVPLAYLVLLEFLKAGFLLKEDIVKVQWNTSTERKWKAMSKGRFQLILHEHLFILYKPSRSEKNKPMSSIRPFKKLLSE